MQVSNHNTHKLVSIDSVLLDIYRVNRSRSGFSFSEDDLRESAAAAASHLLNYKLSEKAICFRCAENHNVVLPDYMEILAVYYKDCVADNEFSTIIETGDTVATIVDDEIVPQVTYKTAYTAKTAAEVLGWVPMRVAHSNEGLGNMCNDGAGVAENCNYTFSVKQSVMTISPPEGYVMIVFRRILRDDEDQSMLIPDIAIVKEAIRAYVLWEMAMFEDIQHREGSSAREEKWLRRWESLSATASGELLMPSLPEWVDIVSETNRLIKNDSPDRLYDDHYGPAYTYLGTDSDYYYKYF